MEFSTGTILGPYRLVAPLGAGGMGEVWKAEDVKLGRSVAIKILPKALENDAEAKARLEREARTAAQLYHPNIATIHAMDETQGRSYIVMEYVEGEPLSALIKRGPVAEAEACRIAKGVADALAEAHARGVVHRDIKPDNILLSGTRVKVLDFGIAKQLGIAGNVTPATLTQTGMILGTVQYMSPEQALGRPLDARTDLFSLGVVMYQMLSAQLPFTAESVTEMLTKIIRDEPADITEWVPQLTPQLAAIVRRCMKKKKEERFATAHELAAAIDEVFPVAATRVSAVSIPTERLVPVIGETTRTFPRRRSLVFAGGLIVAAGIAAGWFAFGRGGSAQPSQDRGAVAAPVITASTAPQPGTAIEVVSTAPATSAPPSETLTAASGAREAKRAVEPAPQPVSKKGEPEKPPAKSEATAAAASILPAAPSSSFDDGMRQLLAGDYDAALVAFQKVPESDPRHAAAALRVAEVRMMQGDRVAAHEAFRAVDGTLLDGREKLLKALAVAALNGNPIRAREIYLRGQVVMPGDRELELVRAAAEALAPANTAPERVMRRRFGPGRRHQ